MQPQPQPKTFTVPDDLHSDLSMALNCFLDDYRAEIKREEKRGRDTARPRATHAKIQRWLLTEFNPSSLSGELKLMDGSTIVRA